MKDGRGQDGMAHGPKGQEDSRSNVEEGYTLSGRVAVSEWLYRSGGGVDCGFPDSLQEQMAVC
jgi:hypothetical protein